MNQRGLVHLLPVLVILALIGVVGFLVFKGKLNISLARKPKVKLQESYNNPFDKDSQYVNPFETYKNPFTTSR